MSRTSSRLAPRARLAALALAALVAPAALRAQAALPEARAVIDRYVEASGGRAALEKAATSHATGTFAMPGAGLSGALVVYSAPNRMATNIDIAGLGVIRSGYNGEVAWSMDPMSGVRVLDGKEKAAMVEATAPGAAWRDPSLVTSLTTVGRDTIQGTACVKVKTVWKSGRETHDCFAEDTGLLHATIASQESPMGTVEVTSVLSDYRTVNGVQMPAKVTQLMMGQQMVTTTDTLEFGSVPSDAFALPPEVQAMVKKP